MTQLMVMIMFFMFQTNSRFSKIGSFETDGNADGLFIYTGFKWLGNDKNGKL